MTYYEEKRKLKENRANFANDLVNGGFLDMHASVIKKYKVIEKEFWENYLGNLNRPGF